MCPRGFRPANRQPPNQRALPMERPFCFGFGTIEVAPPPPSYSAKAEYPVRREFSIPSPTPRNTGSSAFGDDDVESLAPPSNAVIASASEAIQRPQGSAGLLPPSPNGYGGQVVASAPRNDVDGSERNFAFSRRDAPEFCKFIPPPEKQRAQRDPQERARGRPGARCTRCLMCQCICKKTAHEHTGSAEAVRPSLRNGFTAYIVLSPARPGLFVTVIPKKLASQEFDTCHRGVRTTRLCRPRHALFVKSASASTAPRPTSVTMANAPCVRKICQNGRTGGSRKTARRWN
jgi:hypothetical protein